MAPPHAEDALDLLDLMRLRDDTEFKPEYDTAAAAADYIAWLREGNDR